MALRPTPIIIEYFDAVVSLKENENEYARKVVRAFDIRKLEDLWRIAAYINYSTDVAAGFSQIMQSLGFTMWRGEGDCEDFTRALVKVGKAAGFKMYYWLVFADTSYQNGHAMALGISKEGYLTALNYTTIYIAKLKVSEKDIYNNTQSFQQAMRWLNAAIFPFQYLWQVSWIVKTDNDEKPLWYIDAPTDLEPGDVIRKSYPHGRLAIIDYMNRLNLITRLDIKDFAIPALIAAGAGMAAWKVIK